MTNLMIPLEKLKALRSYFFRKKHSASIANIDTIAPNLAQVITDRKQLEQLESILHQMSVDQLVQKLDRSLETELQFVNGQNRAFALLKQMQEIMTQ